MDVQHDVLPVPGFDPPVQPDARTDRVELPVPHFLEQRLPVVGPLLVNVVGPDLAWNGRRETAGNQQLSASPMTPVDGRGLAPVLLADVRQPLVFSKQGRWAATCS